MLVESFGEPGCARIHPLTHSPILFAEVPLISTLPVGVDSTGGASTPTRGIRQIRGYAEKTGLFTFDVHRLFCYFGK